MLNGRLVASVCVCLSIAFTPFGNPVLAQTGTPILAVMTIDSVGVQMSDDMVERLTALLTGLMGSSRKYQVVPREQVKAGLVALKAESHKPCYANSCHIALGQALAAEKSLLTQVIKAGNYCTVSMNVIDLETEAVEKGAVVDGGCTEDEIVRSLKAAAARFEVTHGTGAVSGDDDHGRYGGAVPEVQDTKPRVKSSAITQASGDLTIQAKTDSGIAVRLSVTDPSGRVVVTGSPHKVPRAAIGNWKIVAEATGHITEKQTVYVQPDDASLVKILLKPLGSIEVTGTPAGSAIKVTGPGGFRENGGIPWEAEGLFPGDYRIEVSRAGYQNVTRNVSLEPGQDLRITLNLEKVVVSTPKPPANTPVPQASAPSTPRPAESRPQPAKAKLNESVADLSSACSGGDSEACVRAGDKLSGLDLKAPRPQANPANVAEAVKLYEIACNRNHAVACNQLSVLYGDGRGVTHNDTRSFDYAKKGCDLGSQMGCYHYGLALINGWGCRIDGAKAIPYLEPACNELNLENACLWAGVIWAEGRGVKRDSDKAIPLFLKGCQAGNRECCTRLRRL